MKIKMLRVIAISTILSLIACGDDNSAGANSENGAGLPDAGLSSSSDLTQNFGTFSSGGTASGDDENDLEDARVLDGSEILLRVAGTTSTVENNNGCVVVENQSATLRSSNSPILVKNAEKTVIHLVKGTNNVVEDGIGDHLYVKVNGEPDTAKAAIYARNDLNIKGAGTLVVTDNFRNGIQSSNDLKIKNGTMQAMASKATNAKRTHSIPASTSSRARALWPRRPSTSTAAPRWSMRTAPRQ